MDEIIIGLVSGVVSSFIALLLLFILRPRIRVSKQICKSKSIDSDIYTYTIKFYNQSYFFRLINLEFNLQVGTIENATIGQDIVLEEIPLRRNSKFELDKRSFYKLKRNSKNRYALIITVKGDVDAIWNRPQHQIIELQIKATHSFSNITKVVKIEYRDKTTSIITGKYTGGSSCEIIQINY